MSYAAIPGPICATRTLPIDTGTLGVFRNFRPGPVCSAQMEACPPINQSVAGGFLSWSLSLSPDGIALLKQIETLRLHPYDDQTGKDINAWVIGATIGYGHLIAKQDWDRYKNGITEVDADALFMQDLAPFIQAARDAITVGVQQNEFDALVIFAFNIGVAGFKGSSVVKMINNPQAKLGYASLEDAWKAWNKSQGKVNKGLNNRRAAEWNIYSNATYTRW